MQPRQTPPLVGPVGNHPLAGAFAEGETPWPLEVRHVGCLGVISALWDELGLSELVDDHVPVDKQVALPTSTVVKALVLNIIDGRSALYKVEQWANGVTLDAFLPEVTASQLNDTSLARHLDRIFHAGAEGVFNAACLRVIEREGVKTSPFLADTTSRIVFGEYATEDDGAISMCRGHSKDKRSDLKQIMIGLAVSADGIPLAGHMLSGNTSDLTWHTRMLEDIDKLFPVGEGQEKRHYVGDSALVTKTNLDTAAATEIVLTSRLPRRFSLADSIVIQAVFAPLPMEHLGKFGLQKNATEYEGVVVEKCRLEGHEVQLGVYRATPAQSQTVKSVESRCKKLMNAAVKEAKRLEKKLFACSDDARTALEEFEKKHLAATYADRLLNVDTEVVEVEVEKKPRGRRPKNHVPKMETKFCASISLERNEENIAMTVKRQSCFVLVHTGKDPISARDLLAKYKQQFAVEQKFTFLKDNAQCDVFFVKRPRRVETLGYLMMVSLLLWSVWQRRVRFALDGDVLVDQTTKMKKQEPTAAVLRGMVQNIGAMRLRQNDGSFTPWQFTAPIHPQQALVFHLSGFQGRQVHLTTPIDPQMRRLDSS